MAGAKYILRTFGCQMNKSDSERLKTILDEMGMQEGSDENDADLVLYNSCSVRQAAEDRVFGQLKNLRNVKKKNPKLIVGVTGCLPGRDKDGKIRAKMPIVDLYFPIRDITMLPKWVAELNPDLVNSADLGADYLKIRPKYGRETQSYVSIQTGCNKFCTYCVVPFSRGLEKNRSVEDIVKEITERAEQGTIEVTLLGQTVNNYKAPEGSQFSKGNPYTDNFAALLWEVNQISGIERIHYTAPHPLHMTDEVIDAFTLPKHVNFVHLPVQAGNDEVLRRMNRRYTTAEFLEVVRKIRAKKPDIAIGTDIIVGFCGETEEQFMDTVAMYRAADFDISYTAQYSDRTGTAAHLAFKDDVTIAEKKDRWRRLHAIMEEIVLKKNQSYIDETLEVLVERYQHGVCMGNSREMKQVTFNSKEDLRGKIVYVKVKKAMEWQLSGELVHVGDVIEVPETPSITALEHQLTSST